VVTTLIVGCGYLGRRVGRLLAEGGERVVGIVRSSARAAELADWGIEPMVADLLDPASLTSLPSANRVLHAVALDRSGGASPRAVYVEGLRHLLDRLAPLPRRLVFISSTGVYGQTDGSRVDEDSPTKPHGESGRALLAAEDVLRSFEARHSLDHVILRLAGLYGSGRLIRRTALERGEPIAGDPEHWLNLIHVEDAARFAAALLVRDEPPRRLYEASDDRPVPRREFYGFVARHLGLPPPTFAAGATPSRDISNKRVDSRRIKVDFGLSCVYPDFETGVPASL
jgi:nucleoside-diphosphate-sugar epimerase